MGYEKGKIPVSNGLSDEIAKELKAYGFKWVPVKTVRGKPRPTVSSFAKEHKGGTYILRVSNHVVCADGGKYHDIWDCGSKSLYGYWAKE